MQSIWGYTTAQWKTQQPAYKNGFTSHSEKKFQVDLGITFSFKPGAEREGRTGREVGDGAVGRHLWCMPERDPLGYSYLLPSRFLGAGLVCQSCCRSSCRCVY